MFIICRLAVVELVILYEPLNFKFDAHKVWHGPTDVIRTNQSLTHQKFNEWGTLSSILLGRFHSLKSILI